MRRKLTQQQKEAAAARLAAARAKKGEPSYSQYCQRVVNLPDDHKLSFKKVRQWIKINKAKVPALKKAVRLKQKVKNQLIINLKIPFTEKIIKIKHIMEKIVTKTL